VALRERTTLRGSVRANHFFGRSILRPLARALQWEQTYFVSVTNKPRDSVRLYPHSIRVDDDGRRALQEVLATVKALEQQRSTPSDD